MSDKSNIGNGWDGGEDTQEGENLDKKLIFDDMLIEVLNIRGKIRTGRIKTSRHLAYGWKRVSFSGYLFSLF